MSKPEVSDEGRSPRPLDLPDAEVLFYPAFFAAPEANRLLAELCDTTAWRQETIRLYGKDIGVPHSARRRGRRISITIRAFEEGSPAGVRSPAMVSRRSAAHLGRGRIDPPDGEQGGRR